MPALTASEARSKFYRLLDETVHSHHPVVITGKNGNAVLVSEADWQTLQETIHLLSIPGMRESIKDGLATSLDECEEDIEW